MTRRQFIVLAVSCLLYGCGGGGGGGGGEENINTTPAQTVAKYDGINPARLNGLTCYNTITSQDFDFLEAQGVNATSLRLMLLDGDMLQANDIFEVTQNDKITSNNFAKLDAILTETGKRMITVVLDIHQSPGNVSALSAGNIPDDRIWDDTPYGAKCRQAFANAFGQLALRYHLLHPDAIVYQTGNELQPPAGKESVANQLQIDALKAIRKYDTAHSVVVSPPNSWRVEAFESYTPPAEFLADSKVLFAANAYQPNAITTDQWQAWIGQANWLPYPGLVAGKYWDRQTVEDNFSSMIAFRNKYERPVITTEFSIIRMVPSLDATGHQMLGAGAVAWLKDMTSILIAHQIPGFYHVYGEREAFLAHGWPYDNTWFDLWWSPERPDQIADPARLLVVKNWLSQAYL